MGGLGDFAGQGTYSFPNDELLNFACECANVFKVPGQILFFTARS